MSNLTELQLRNLQSRFGPTATPTSGQVLTWDATNLCYAPKSLATVGSTSLQSVSNVAVGGAAAILYADLVGGSGVTTGTATIGGVSTAGKTVLLTQYGLYTVSSGGVWTQAYTAARLTNRYVLVDSNATYYTSADGINFTTTSFQPTLVSGTNIKTINGVSVLGSGDIAIAAGGITAQGPMLTVTLAEALTAGVGVWWYTTSTPSKVSSYATAGGTPVFAGILAAAGASGSSQTVVTKGAILIQSVATYTPNTLYYITNAGAITSTATGNTLLGRAMSAKHLLLTF